jgi:hypothetical protein
MKVESANWAMRRALTASFLSLAGFAASPAEAALRIDGQVQAGGGPVANSTVTLWSGSAGEPRYRRKRKRRMTEGFTQSRTRRPDRAEPHLVANGGVACQQARGRQSRAAFTNGGRRAAD